MWRTEYDRLFLFQVGIGKYNGSIFTNISGFNTSHMQDLCPSKICATGRKFHRIALGGEWGGKFR